MTGALTDPFGNGLMGVTAENVAKRWQVTRAEQDQFAVQRHHHALHGAEQLLRVGETIRT